MFIIIAVFFTIIKFSLFPVCWCCGKSLQGYKIFLAVWSGRGKVHPGVYLLDGLDYVPGEYGFPHFWVGCFKHIYQLF